MKPWNQAAWKQNTYRKRVTVNPVGDEVLSAAGDGGCCRVCGYFVHAPSCPSQRARETRLPRTPDASIHPRGWDVADTSVEQDASPSLTLAEVARLPVGTRVVVVEGDAGGADLEPGAVLTLQFANRLGVVFNGWSIGFDAARNLTFRLAEPAKSPTVVSDEECSACDGLGDFGAPCGNGGAPCEECGGLGRVPSEPPLLTLSEAAEACRAGKVSGP